MTKTKNYQIKEWIIFSVFSLFCAYTHYYALIVAAIVNNMLLITFIIRRDKKNIKCEIESAILQVLLYLPWLSALIKQTKVVSNGYWIGKAKIIEVIKFIFTGSLNDIKYIPDIVTIPFSFVILIFLIYLLIKNWKKESFKPVRLIFYIWTCLIILVEIIGLIIN